MLTLDDLYDVWTIDHRIEYTETHNPDTCPICQKIIAVGKQLYAQGADEEDQHDLDVDYIIDLCEQGLTTVEIAQRVPLGERFVTETLIDCGLPFYRGVTTYTAKSDTQQLEFNSLSELANKLHVSAYHLRDKVNTKMRVKGFLITITTVKQRYVGNMLDTNYLGDKE